jgi:hypothetical protein
MNVAKLQGRGRGKREPATHELSIELVLHRWSRLELKEKVKNVLSHHSFHTLNLDLCCVIAWLKNPVSELNRGRREDLKYAKIFTFRGVLKLRCGGATTGHRTGKQVSIGEERSVGRCFLL